MMRSVVFWRAAFHVASSHGAGHNKLQVSVMGTAVMRSVASRRTTSHGAASPGAGGEEDGTKDMANDGTEDGKPQVSVEGTAAMWSAASQGPHATYHSAATHNACQNNLPEFVEVPLAMRSVASHRAASHGATTPGAGHKKR